MKRRGGRKNWLGKTKKLGNRIDHVEKASLLLLLPLRHYPSCTNLVREPLLALILYNFFNALSRVHVVMTSAFDFLSSLIEGVETSMLFYDMFYEYNELESSLNVAMYFVYRRYFTIYFMLSGRKTKWIQGDSKKRASLIIMYSWWIQNRLSLVQNLDLGTRLFNCRTFF